MGLLDNDGFLSELTRLFGKCKSSGSLYITMKRYNGQTKPRPRKGKESSEPSDPPKLCLVRASIGKKKISTVVSAKDVNRFQMAYANLLRAHVDGLKKPERTKGKKSKSGKE